ncbi:MAG: serine/threonine protein kinase [Bacteroidetes bacterium]|jgi:hypothetical protein|nr:serine/threonine protein kinase [Bacteroidota bacterium]
MLPNRKTVLGVFALAVLFSSCGALKQMPTANNDDVYLDPKKDRTAFYKADEPKPVETASTQQVVVPQDTSNNPYYADRDFDYDDYYDNQYASRIRRFHNPNCGVGYYDSYYTNSYFYNYNPYQYGVSIYNGYNFWGPSYNNYMYVSNYNWGGYYGYGSNYGYNSYCNSGWGIGLGYGYSSGYYNNWYNPYSYGYNPYYGYNNFYNPYYSPYGYGGYNPYGYSNPYDYNSYSYYGPRVSHSGGNSRQLINPGMDPMKVMNPNTSASNEPKGAAPTDIKRFNQVVPTPKETYTKGNTNGNSDPRPVNPNAGNNNSDPQLINTNHGNSTPVSQPVKSNPVVIQPANTDHNNNASSQPVNDPPKPKKGGWFNTQPVGGNGSGSTPTTTSEPKPKKGGWFESQPINNNNSGGNNNVVKPSSGSSFPSGGGGGHNGGGGGGGKVRPR